MSCKTCGSDKKVVARGLCRACYSRWYTRGTTDYAPKPQKVACSVGGCVDLAIAKGMCDKHYRRMKHHGDVEHSGPIDWGKRSKHPLYGVWKHFRRFKGRQSVCQEWLDDFWQFVFDVGEKPSDKHKLFVADESKPLGPDNYVWKRSHIEKVDGEDRQTYQNRAQRAYRKVKEEAYKSIDLKKLYGLTLEQLDQMLEEQDHKCAICGEEESQVINGKTIRLAVDHCHDSGAVRGLLCMNCNRGLGLFKDDPARLKHAIAYLEG